MLSTIAGYGKGLQQWEEVLEHSHPSYQHGIPYPSSMNIGKLGSNGALESDTLMGQVRCSVLFLSKVMRLRKL